MFDKKIIDNVGNSFFLNISLWFTFSFPLPLPLGLRSGGQTSNTENVLSDSVIIDHRCARNSSGLNASKWGSFGQIQGNYFPCMRHAWEIGAVTTTVSLNRASNTADWARWHPQYRLKASDHVIELFQAAVRASRIESARSTTAVVTRHIASNSWSPADIRSACISLHGHAFALREIVSD